MLSASFPEPAGFVCDSWCYESDALVLQDSRRLDAGAVELRHLWRDHDGLTLVTTATPMPGAVRILARVEGQRQRPAPGQVDEYPPINICWQVRRAPGFASWPQDYQQFVKRCFIFTDRGRTFLDATERFRIPVRAPEDSYNNPPWVQMYLPVWRPPKRAPADSWADYSSDQYVYPVIGVVSQDGRYLAAIATQSNACMSQAWHDCLHNDGEWTADSDRPDGKVWQMFIYVMKDDPQALLRRLASDLPAAMTQHQSVPPESFTPGANTLPTRL